MNLEDRISINRAAELTNYDIETLRRLARQNKIDAVKHGQEWWIVEASISTYKDAKPQRKPQPNKKPRKVAANG